MINVTNIERFATHDGPGIRTVVFLKGCPLFCPWCANPETQSAKPVLMHDTRKCGSCRMCEKVCPAKAISFKNNVFSYDETKCIRCFKCEKECLNDAIEFHGKSMELKEIMEIIMKDKAYYDNSNGGITISGGEPFVQFNALMDILKALKEKGLHTAIETTGNYSIEKLKESIPFVDLYLYDFKYLSDETLKEVAGGNGNLIKTNLAFLLKHHPEKVIVRMPMIPTFNFDHDNIIQSIDYIKSLGALEVNLLPYHSLGKVKYEKMGKVYELPVKMMENKELDVYHNYALSLGLKSKIGG